MPILLLDNGAGHIKAAYMTDGNPLYITNAAASVQKTMQRLVGDEIDMFRNGSVLQFSRPFERGYLVNWQCQIEVWNHLFSDKLRTAPSETSLILTEPLMNLSSIQHECNEVVFEYFGFKEYVRKPSMWFSSYKCTKDNNVDEQNVCTIVESGFSSSHIAPFFNYKCYRPAIKRVDVGGKLLTNYLKELISYRQWNMMDEFLLMNEIKEKLCYVSNDALADVIIASKEQRTSVRSGILKDHNGNNLKRHFVLPDFNKIFQGYVKNEEDPPDSTEQILSMETERFAVPEVLFNSIDIGLDEAGIAEATWQSLKSLHSTMEIDLACSNIQLTGGNTKFPNFKRRFEKDLRPHIPGVCNMQVNQSDSPELFAWFGMQQYQRDIETQQFASEYLTKTFYDEHGSDICNKVFDKIW